MASKKTTKKTTEPYVILRGYRSGCHAGYLVARNENGCYVLRDARRLWYWSGAASLSEVAVYGAKNAAQCKFGARVERQEISRDDVSEVIHCQPEGQCMIENTPEWRA